VLILVKKIFFALLTLTLFLVIITGCKKEEENLVIGILQTVDHPTLATTYQGIIDQIAAYNFQNEKPINLINLGIEKGQLINKDSPAGNDSQDYLKDLDLIIAISSRSLYDISQIENEFPIVFTAVSNPANVYSNYPTSQKGKILSGVSDMIPIEDQFKLLKKLLPSLQRVGVIYNPAEKLSSSQIELIKSLEEAYNLTCLYQTVDSSAAAIDAAKNMLGEIDALYVPSDLTVTPVIQDMTIWTDLANKPIVSGDERGIEQGALCTVVVDYYKLGKQTGTLAIKAINQKILLENQPVEKSKHNRIMINIDTAAKLNIKVPSDLEQNAKD